MRKKNARVVVHTLYKAMEKMLYTSRDSTVSSVSGLLSGKSPITVPCTFSTGFGSGLWRVIPLANSVGFLDIVHLNLMPLKIIGYRKYLKRRLIIPKFSIWSMILPTSIRMEG